MILTSPRYVALSSAQTLYAYFIEGSTVFVGKRKTLDKRVSSCSCHVPSHRLSLHRLSQNASSSNLAPTHPQPPRPAAHARHMPSTPRSSGPHPAEKLFSARTSTLPRLLTPTSSTLMAFWTKKALRLGSTSLSRRQVQRHEHMNEHTYAPPHTTNDVYPISACGVFTDHVMYGIFTPFSIIYVAWRHIQNCCPRSLREWQGLGAR
jgi:hypothetical protein